MMNLALNPVELLSYLIRIGELELVFDTSALFRMSDEFLINTRNNGVKLSASPYCVFELVRHLADKRKFEDTTRHLRKIDSIEIAHIPTYESSKELGIARANPRKRHDSEFAAAIAHRCSMLNSYDEVETAMVPEPINGSFVPLIDLINKMRTRIREIHIEHMNSVKKFKEMAINYLETNHIDIFDVFAAIKTTGQIWIKFQKEETEAGLGIRACELEGFLRYLPHVGGMLCKYFSGMNIGDITGVTAPVDDGVDYRVSLHIGMNSNRILVSDDRKMHINPLSQLIEPYNIFIHSITSDDAYQRKYPLALSVDDLIDLQIDKELNFT